MLGYSGLPDPAGPGRHRLALLLVPRRWTRRTRSCWARRCCSPASRRSCRWLSARSTSAGKEFRAGGYVGDRLAAVLAEYLNRTGLDHPDPDAALRRHHPVDAVLVRAALLRAVADGPGALGRVARWRSEQRRDEKAARQAAPGGAQEAPGQGSVNSKEAKGTKTPKELPIGPLKPSPEPGPRPIRRSFDAVVPFEPLRPRRPRPPP